MILTARLTTSLLFISLAVYTASLKSDFYVIVRPTDSNTFICEESATCDTLSNLISNNSDIFSNRRAYRSTSIFKFLPGNHTLDVKNSTQLFTEVVHNLIWDGNEMEKTVIICEHPFMFGFHGKKSLTIKNLSFLKCGQTVQNFILEEIKLLAKKVCATLVLVEHISFTIQNVTISQSKGYGLLGVNLRKSNHIISSHFLDNNQRSSAVACAGGGAAFYFRDTQTDSKGKRGKRSRKTKKKKKKQKEKKGKQQSLNKVSISITHSFFHNGTDHLPTEKTFYSCSNSHKSNPLFRANGLAIVAKQTTYHVEIITTDTTFSQNIGNGFNPAVWIHDSGRVATVNRFEFKRCRFENEGTVRISSWQNQKCKNRENTCVKKHKNKQKSSVFIHITNCSFTNSSHTALEVWIKPIEQGNRFQQVSITKSIFQDYHKNEKKANISVIRITYITCYKLSITIAESHFISNAIPVLVAQLEYKKYASLLASKSAILDLQENFFFRNSDLNNAVIHIRVLPNDLISLQKYERSTYRNSEIVNKVGISKCKFKNNTSAKNQGILRIENVYIILHNSTFESSQGTALYALRSVVHFEGSNLFNRNNGTFGGAFNLNMSQVLVTSNSHTLITNNSALYGGGVFATANFMTFDTEKGYIYNRCTINQEPGTLSNRIEFAGNRAEHMGHSIFGGTYKNCRSVCTEEKKNCAISSSNFFEAFVGTSANVNNSNDIVCPPSKLCICQNGHEVANQCATSINLTAFPGETFIVSVVAMDELNSIRKAVVAGTVCKDYSENECTRDFKNDIGYGQRMQELNKECTDLTFTIHGKSQVSIEVKIDYDETSKTFEGVTMKNFLEYKKSRMIIRDTPSPCPVGLEYEGSDKLGRPSACKCLKHFTRQGVRCNVNNGTVTKPKHKWLYSDIGSIKEPIPLLANKTVVHNSCPYDYCIKNELSVFLSEPDQQCNFKRSGILCGACKKNLSIVLGTSNCKKCSNVYLLLLVPFALAGIALVVLLLKCNLTVSIGHINGIIFYANIVQVNKPLLFPNTKATAYKIFSTFIAWLNLDLGIETCFFENMDSYDKVWLQFVFPVYLWTMIGLIVLLANYSTKLGRMIGNNSVPVLATLFLLSYAKLLRTIIAAESFAFIEFDNGSYFTVWLNDGNVKYLSSIHAVLFLVAFLFAILYILPLTLLVLLAPCLQAMSHHKVFKWVNRLKPFLDAYQGPYSDKFRYWTGLLLILRVLLFTIDAFNFENDSSMSFFWTTITLCPLAMICLIKGNVYRHKFANHLETLSLLNIVILCLVNWLTTTTGYGKWHPIREYATYISVTVMIIAFTITVLYQICVKIVPKPIRKVTKKEEIDGTSSETRVNEKTQATYSVVEMEPLKEPLLDTE